MSFPALIAMGLNWVIRICIRCS